jgi:DNA-binding HxlR family transcriptional regulator
MTKGTRSYKQRCGLAKALDLIGDRWTLLIVRELLICGSCRYTDLRTGLPGIASNLLAERLRELEEAGLVIRERAAAPIAVTLFRLTELGLGLEGAVLELGSWGAPLLADSADDDVLLGHWLVLPLKLKLADGDPDGPPIRIEVLAGDQPISISAAAGRIDVSLGAAGDAGALISGEPALLLDLFSGKLDLAAAEHRGAKFHGDPKLLDRVISKASRAA